MPINIDIDVKIEKIHVYPLEIGMKALFELRDANNPETNLYLMFYKKQIDYIMKQFYKVDKEKIRQEFELDFIKRWTKKERQMKTEFQLEYDSLKQQYDELWTLEEEGA